MEIVNSNQELGTVGGYPRKATNELEVQGKNPGVYDAIELMDAYKNHEQNIDFLVFHTKCDPHPNTEGYVIELSRAKSITDWVGWTLHLFQKSWMGREDLEHMLLFWWSHKKQTSPDP
ncbi:MAG: hypothetical protein H8F28_16995 [Fibrella sp.]|nr:hypothetical protein [Armatimonadota bacterium]